jgi:hypothetical protein
VHSSKLKNTLVPFKIPGLIWIEPMDHNIAARKPVELGDDGRCGSRPRPERLMIGGEPE